MSLNKNQLIPHKSNIRINEREGKYVVFNLETSGFHMITADGYAVLDQVDGQRDIRQIATYFASKKGVDQDQMEKNLIGFFEGLALRRIVTLRESELPG